MRHQRSPIARSMAVLGLTLVSVAACHDVTSAADRVCAQTYEFGNTGCFEVTGVVVGQRGQPLSGIAVGLHYLPAAAGRDVGTFAGGYASTDSLGQFRLRAVRYVPPPPGTVAADTFSVYVNAADPRSAGVGVPATIQDSVLTPVRVFPVGAEPLPAVVRITLPMS